MSPAPPPAFSFSRLAGTALGTMCGDALGMPVEGWTPQAIRQAHGRLDRFLPGRLPAGNYTDDSEMMLALLESLVLCQGLDPADLAQRFAANFDPRRGYGARIFGVVERIRAGMAWDQVGTDSFGNGAAMRVGVLGAYFAPDEETLLPAALDQGRITHQHPQGLAGAAAQALAVGLACRLGAAGQARDQAAFVVHLAARVAAVDAHTAARLAALPPLAGLGEDAARARLSGEYTCDVTAPESVPPALGSFLWADSAADAIVLAVSLGGDTDTIGAMAGALAGAYWGVENLPPRWLKTLEDGPRGASLARELAKRPFHPKSG
ncbi:MAG: ADP-ribosylglycohydrolase family protein [Deltaproteobacteria bacterium]|nr:ADP-ribosylglycohydrolase family protein [Deltaproteobacteria bacterium]